MRSDSNYDSELCGSLPIHLINHVQPYGALMIIQRSSLKIVQVSENIDRVFGIPAVDLVNMPLSRFLSDEFSESVKERFTVEIRDKVPEIWEINGKSFVTTEHLRGDLLIVEIDLQEADEVVHQSFVQVYKEIKFSMGLLQSASTIQEVAETCAKELKRLSGFDKVMVYRFDKDWNGTVIAEVMEPGMESYLGITFPASDVPQQARALYLKNPYRFIPDRTSAPVKLYPVINPVTNSFVDLSDCNLRSVAAVHLEYLKNMGVIASMSTRLLFGDVLWGLIACHHRKPKMLSYELRAVFEMLGNIVSGRIAGIINSDSHVTHMHAKEQYKDIVESTYREQSLAGALLHQESNVKTLFRADGAVLTEGNRIFTTGNVPDREQLRELILWLHAHQLRHVYSTDCLSAEYEPAAEFRDLASGMLVIPIGVDSDEYVIVFRPEVVRVIEWGGNPEDRIRFETGTKNYHPRSSFDKWKQMVEGCSVPWREDELAVAENLRSFIYEFSN